MLQVSHFDFQSSLTFSVTNFSCLDYMKLFLRVTFCCTEEPKMQAGLVS